MGMTSCQKPLNTLNRRNLRMRLTGLEGSIEVCSLTIARNRKMAWWKSRLVDETI